MIKRIIEKLFRLEPEFCPNCEILKVLLESERAEKKALVDTVIEFSKPKPMPEPAPPSSNLTPIRTTRFTPWRVRKETIEEEDRQRARLIRQKTEELENQLGLNATRAEATEKEG